MHPIFCSHVQVCEVAVALYACPFEKAFVELYVPDTLKAQRNMDSCLVFDCVAVRSVFWDELGK